MLVAIIGMASCEKYNPSTTEYSHGNEDDANGNVTLQLDSCSQERVTFSIFQDGKKVKTIHQDASSSELGTVHISLDEGTYTVVAIAHNGNGNCTISSPEKITFPNNKVTDTFFYYDTLYINKKPLQQDLHLRRAVAAFNLHITDEIPSNIHQFKFYYTGGSSTFNAVTGYGCANSRQTEYLEARPNLANYMIYTFPHEAEKKLKIVITAQDAENKDITSKTFEDVSILKNHITHWSGDFFHQEEADRDASLGFIFEDTWKEENNVPFFHKSR